MTKYGVVLNDGFQPTAIVVLQSVYSLILYCDKYRHSLYYL